MAQPQSQLWYSRVHSLVSRRCVEESSVDLFAQAVTLFERLMLSAQTLINGNLPEANGNASPLSSSQQARDFRPVEMPKTKIGLASTDGELVVLFKKYLEIVGLVFFVWLLGKCSAKERK